MCLSCSYAFIFIIIFSVIHIKMSQTTNSINGNAYVNEVNYFHEIHLYFAEVPRDLCITLMRNMAIKYVFVGCEKYIPKKEECSNIHLNIMIEFFDQVSNGLVYRLFKGLNPNYSGHMFVKQVKNRECMMNYLFNKYRMNYIEGHRNLLNNVKYHVHGSTEELSETGLMEDYDSNLNYKDIGVGPLTIVSPSIDE